ncbi:hypothetical protein [Wolbachia endosymbiont of Pentidionis agamae]|uniref:hypothetical protein n=1 Tax=Wolbachia endosymbiont of Pentidionis agamae TaxID=3110435 RepID=UPI002FD3424B
MPQNNKENQGNSSSYGMYTVFEIRDNVVKSRYVSAQQNGSSRWLTTIYDVKPLQEQKAVESFSIVKRT